MELLRVLVVARVAGVLQMQHLFNQTSPTPWNFRPGLLYLLPPGLSVSRPGRAPSRP
jgi:hypothetical protein